jgi:Tfp pilus assembly protein PilV
MRRVWLITNLRASQAGFSIVEALLAATVFGMLTTGIIGAVIYGRTAVADSGDHQRAVMMAEEGLDAAKNIGNASYATLVDGTYGIVQSGGQWTLSGTSDISGIYTRQITIAAVGTNRKTVTSTVAWGASNVSMSTRIVNWEANIKLWSNAITGGSVDATGTTDGLKVSADGNYAYMVRNTTTSNFVIFNISTPTAPTIVSTTTISGTPTNIEVANGYAYITTSTAASGLLIYNVATPAAPTLTKTVSFTGTAAARGVTIKGSYAYVVRASDTATNANEFNVVNIATPASAAVVGGYNNNIQMNEVYAYGNYAFVATSSTTAEMLVINVTTPATPTLGATYNPATALAALTVTAINDGTTVLLGMGTTLDAISVSSPTTPTRLGTYTAAGTINDVAVDVTDQYAFLGTASTTGEFQVINISSKSAMALTKTVDVTGTTSTVSGLDYASSLDVVVGASSSDTQEGIVFTRN